MSLRRRRPFCMYCYLLMPAAVKLAVRRGDVARGEAGVWAESGGMTRGERARRKAARLELAACISAFRATNAADPLGRVAIVSGLAASRNFRKAAQLLAAEVDRASAAEREKKAKKLPSDWWRGKRGVA